MLKTIFIFTGFASCSSCSSWLRSSTGCRCVSHTCCHLQNKPTSRGSCLHSLPTTASYSFLRNCPDVPADQLLSVCYQHAQPRSHILCRWQGSYSLLRPTGLCGPTSDVHCVRSSLSSPTCLHNNLKHFAFSRRAR